jgi:hypothetical protein
MNPKETRGAVATSVTHTSSALPPVHSAPSVTVFPPGPAQNQIDSNVLWHLRSTKFVCRLAKTSFETPWWYCQLVCMRWYASWSSRIRARVMTGISLLSPDGGCLEDLLSLDGPHCWWCRSLCHRTNHESMERRSPLYGQHARKLSVAAFTHQPAHCADNNLRRCHTVVRNSAHYIRSSHKRSTIG